MSASKLLLGTIIGTIVFFGLDALFYGMLMRGVFTSIEGYDREWPQWLWLIIGIILFMGAFTYIYNVGEDKDSSRVGQGARYGILMGIMIGFGMGFILYSLQEPKPIDDFLMDGVYTTIKFVILGVIIAYATGQGMEGAGGDAVPPPTPEGSDATNISVGE